MPSAPPAREQKKPTPPPAKQAGKQANGGATQNTSNAQQAAPGQTNAAGQHAPRSESAGVQNAPGAATGQQNFDKMAVRAKLAVSEPGDAVEREADAVADKVMRMPDPTAASKPGASPVASPPSPAAGKPKELARKEEPKNKTSTQAAPATSAKPAPQQPQEQESPGAPAAANATKGMASENAIQRKAASPQHEGAMDNTEIQRKSETSQQDSQSGQSAANQPGTTQELIQGLGAGEALDADTLAYFEKRMGADFSHVRIHTDTAASRAAKQINAHAFTYGHHVAFAEGAFQPQSEAGRFLLAHELAHVLQQSGGSVSRMIMRTPTAAAPSGDFEVTHADLEVPPIKARHLGGYKALADAGSLKRKGAYDASTRGTKQMALWTGGVKPDINKIPSGQRPSTTAGFDLNLNIKGGAAAKVIKASSLDELNRLLQIPTWDNAGADVQFQVDHMVEYQLGGADALENMELLNQAHNGSVGSSFSHGIKRTVREEIQQDPTKPALTTYIDASSANKDPTADGVMEAMTVVFKKLKGRARESKRKEGGSMFWSKEQIEALDHVLSMLGSSGDLKGDANDFALLSPTGGLLIAKLHHGNGNNTITITGNQSGGMAGFKMKRLVLNDKYNDAAAGSNIGTLEGSLNFGPAVAIPPGNVSVGVTQAKNPGEHSGKVGATVGTGLPNEVDFKPMSPLALTDITLGKSVFGKASLKPSHPALSGISIPAQIMDGKLGLFYTLDATALAGKLKIPGVKIDSAAVTFGYDGEDFSVAGGTEFTIQKFGTGFLNAYADTSGDFSLEGGLRADKRLFDKAEMKLWYRKKGGFGGSGTLAITQPGKIKGIKSATLNAKYEDSVFSADGTVIPDIPGLKAASLSVTYANDQLDITGKLAIDDKVPGVQSADITVNLKQVNDGWKVAASGDVTPKLPALSGAKLKFTYDDGFVLMEGEFGIEKGPVSGKFKAGVTNGTVDEKGVRTEGGSGDKFSAFGTAEVDAIFIKDKLAGKLMLRLLPDGTVRVGGGLKVADFDVFPQIPKDGGEFFNKEISTPRIPLPGLGFAVGSMSVGVAFWASGHIKAHASIGPGKMTGITLTIAEFDPANIDLNTLEVGGKSKFVVNGDAGVEVGADVNVGLSAAVVDLVGSLGVTGEVGIPKNTPILTADTGFTYSQAKGLNIGASCNLDISPSLVFKLKGGFSAKLNLYVETVTLWHQDWTLAEANYKLPIGITANGALNYSSKTGKLNADPASAIKVKTPEFKAEDFKRILDGSPAPTTETFGKDGKPVPGTETKVHPKTRDNTAPGHNAQGVDDNLLARLGAGFPLDDATRNYFEQRLKIDLTRVRIHTEPAAAEEAERLSARAFTLGDDIVFNLGEYRPDSPDGQELLAHELAHVAQNQGVSEPIVMRWPAVTRTTARSSETPVSVRAMHLAEFISFTNVQLDWATSTDLQADAAALANFRQIRDFGTGAQITSACGDISVGDIETKGVPAVFPHLRTYTRGAASGNTAWLRRTDDINKAERWGRDLGSLESAWPAANLSLVMRAPDPANDPVAHPSPFEKLSDGVTPELPNFISYLSTCAPILSADDGSEVTSFMLLRGEGVMPTSYVGSISHVKNYHHFTKSTLKGLAHNEAVPQWQQSHWFLKKPMTAVLYPSVDHNGAFHRNRGLETMVNDSAALTIVIEGLTSVADYATALAPVATRYGRDGQIQQAMIGGHGNTNIMVLAGTMTGNTITNDSIGTAGVLGANTTTLMTALTTVMSSNPVERRIVLDACLTNSHLVGTAIRPAALDAAADIQASIAANPSLRDVVATQAGAGSTVIGSNSSFAPASTRFITPGDPTIGLSTLRDPNLADDKIIYVEFGTEPEGCMRAVLECWASDQIAGTHLCQDAMTRRITATRSAHVTLANTKGWDEAIIQSLYHLATHAYAGNGEALRRMGYLAGHLAEMYWAAGAGEPAGSQADGLNALLVSALGGAVGDIARIFGALAADSHYASSPRLPLVIEQVWMNYDAGHRPAFMAALVAAGDCTLAFQHLHMPLIMPQVAALLTLPAPSPPAADQLRLALLTALHTPVASPPPSPLPVYIDFLTQLLGAGPEFPPGLGLGAVLGSRFSSDDVLTAIGKPLPGAAPAAVVGAPPPDANIDTRHDASNLNDFRVTPLQANGEVDTVRDDLQVRSTPTTGSSANIFAHLPKGTRVIIIGEYNANWYAIEQPGRTGFVFKRYIKIVP